ncbi:hypothetical protein NDU88_006686 [Pleurodeles waltl]|uniref:Uncharacterized protein n=1 Tax=Pleurodeles waltl TaxID=8319 RepID=A0AAV7LPT6_PLEWA|nr:hypothetical protein NDU88_006686 [Pleurodeles waltl]
MFSVLLKVTFESQTFFFDPHVVAWVAEKKDLKVRFPLQRSTAVLGIPTQICLSKANLGMTQKGAPAELEEDQLRSGPSVSDTRSPAPSNKLAVFTDGS